eukprot:gene1162-8822_t
MAIYKTYSDLGGGSCKLPKGPMLEADALPSQWRSAPLTGLLRPMRRRGGRAKKNS